MGFRINTNVAALNAYVYTDLTNKKLQDSLEKLSSGLRINKAADDASGLQIADSLRNQSDSLGRAIQNANEAIGIMQIADKGMDEQVNITDTIKTKALQAAQDGQTADTRKALQEDISKLMDELDNIAHTTTYNGKHLLDGSFTNQKFQVGAYSNQTVTASIGATSSDKIGAVRYETGKIITAAGDVKLTFKNIDGLHDFNLQSVKISTSAGTGVGVLADTINRYQDKTGIKANWQVLETGSQSIQAGDVKGLTINGVQIGDILGVQDNDSDGKLVNAINAVKDLTGVEAYTDERGNLNLRSLDGRGIDIDIASGASNLGLASHVENYGRLTLSRLDARDIVVSGTGAGLSASAETTVNLRTIKRGFTADEASAIGFFANSNVADYGQTTGAGVTTLKGAMAAMDIADSAQKMLDKIRGDIGSVQNQLTSTVNNISVTQVNVKSAESQIRDVDFAKETENYNKYSVLAQSGSYALAQANNLQQMVLNLLK